MSITKNQKGKKRLCTNCNSKWYDFNKLPLVCPVCKEEFEMIDNDNLNFTNLNTPNKNIKVSEDNLSESDQENKDEVIDESEEDIISLEDIEEEN